MKKELIYFKNGNIICYIYGYYSHYKALEFAKLMQENADLVAKLAECNPEDVTYCEINTSRRYKGMIAFMVKTTTIPNDAYVVDNEYWDVIKWLTD